MAGKVTLYVRDEELWGRAREASGPGGLSDLVQQALRSWLSHARASAPAPTPLERARRLSEEAGALVAALEAPRPRSQARRAARRRRARAVRR